MYGINPRHAIDLTNPGNTISDDWASKREILRKDASDSIAHAQVMMKASTDKKRQDFTLAVGDFAYIRLHKGYHLPGIPKAKLGQQRVGPFEVEAVVGTNAYKLKLPTGWKIWPVITAIYLDCAPPGPDPYDRTIDIPQPVLAEGEFDANALWEVAAVVKKRVVRRKVEYLVRWKGFGPEYDEWLPEAELQHCKGLIEEYERAVGLIAT